MRYDTFNAKLQAMKAYPLVSADHLEALAKILPRLDDWHLMRINPFLFAQAQGWSATESLDLFLVGAKVGLFDFIWNMICPYCGGVADRHSSINQVQETQFYCTNCDAHVESDLSQLVQVLFALNPSVKPLQVNPQADLQAYLLYFWGLPGKVPTVIQKYADAVVQGFVGLAAQEHQVFSFETQPHSTYRLFSMDRHIGTKITTGARSEEITQLTVDCLPLSCLPAHVEIPAGPLHLLLRNQDTHPLGLMLIYEDTPVIMEIFRQNTIETYEALTGEMLLNNQVFRDLFRVQTLNPSLKLPIKTLTILFTDLKGSTALYDKTGDAFAYQLIQEHFAELTAVVKRNEGAVIKTMGDAVMAAFSHPAQGVQAALEMMQRISLMNDRIQESGHVVGLKIGVHEGAALAVNLDDRLDYFGQTINIGARVEGLAKAGEIWMTQSVFQAPGVPALLKDQAYEIREKEVALKGVGTLTRVYQCLHPQWTA